MYGIVLLLSDDCCSELAAPVGPSGPSAMLCKLFSWNSEMEMPMGKDMFPLLSLLLWLGPDELASWGSPSSYARRPNTRPACWYVPRSFMQSSASVIVAMRRLCTTRATITCISRCTGELGRKKEAAQTHNVQLLLPRTFKAPYHSTRLSTSNYEFVIVNTGNVILQYLNLRV